MAELKETIRKLRTKLAKDRALRRIIKEISERVSYVKT